MNHWVLIFWGVLVAWWVIKVIRLEIEHERDMRTLDEQRRKIDAEWAAAWGDHLSRPIDWKDQDQ